jgi:hypothetical protein
MAKPSVRAVGAIEFNRAVTAVIGGLVLVVAATVAGIYRPIGVPLACAALVYVVTVMAGPQRLLRGRLLSPAQQQRAALIVAAAMLAFTGLCSAAVYGIQLANTLEQRLRDEIDVQRTRGELTIGQSFQECAPVACAEATIVQLPSRRAVGIARLSGFAMHEQKVFGWHKSAQDMETGTGSGTPPLSQQHHGR